MKEQLRQVLEVLTLAEKLKYELRHSWLSNGRQESVAEHTWRMSLMVVLLEPYLDQEIDVAHTLKMVIVHDLVEAEAGDMPAFEVTTPELQQLKRQRELQAIENLRTTLGGGLGQHVYELWHDFEDKLSYEALVANALDKLELRLQHNHAALDTWLEVEQEAVFQLEKHTWFDTCLQQLRELIEEQAVQKMEDGGIDVASVKEHLTSKRVLAV